MKCLNLVGPQIRKLRYVRGWSQNILAVKLQILGWDIDRVGVAKIESRLVHIDEYELLYFAKVLCVGLADLFPKIDPARNLHEAVVELMRRRPSPSLSNKTASRSASCSQAGTPNRSQDAKLPRNGYGSPTQQHRNFDGKRPGATGGGAPRLLDR